jgi:hypothetical protein
MSAQGVTDVVAFNPPPSQVTLPSVGPSAQQNGNVAPSRQDCAIQSLQYAVPFWAMVTMAMLSRKMFRRTLIGAFIEMGPGFDFKCVSLLGPMWRRDLNNDPMGVTFNLYFAGDIPGRKEMHGD